MLGVRAMAVWKKSIPPSKIITEILPGGSSLVKPESGIPDKNKEAPEAFKKSLRVNL